MMRIAATFCSFPKEPPLPPMPNILMFGTKEKHLFVMRLFFMSKVKASPRRLMPPTTLCLKKVSQSSAKGTSPRTTVPTTHWRLVATAWVISTSPASSGQASEDKATSLTFE